MAQEPDDSSTATRRPDVDSAGVDRAQIRAFLELTPEERLRRVEEHVEAILEIREKNAAGGIRCPHCRTTKVRGGRVT
ncbi:MAG: hypothetical protein U0599_05950 [Vicinamibacteria bacterium]